MPWTMDSRKGNVIDERAYVVVGQVVLKKIYGNLDESWRTISFSIDLLCMNCYAYNIDTNKHISTNVSVYGYNISHWMVKRGMASLTAKLYMDMPLAQDQLEKRLRKNDDQKSVDLGASIFKNSYNFYTVYSEKEKISYGHDYALSYYHFY